MKIGAVSVHVGMLLGTESLVFLRVPVLLAPLHELNVQFREVR